MKVAKDLMGHLLAHWTWETWSGWAAQKSAASWVALTVIGASLLCVAWKVCVWARGGKKQRVPEDVYTFVILRLYHSDYRPSDKYAFGEMGHEGLAERVVTDGRWRLVADVQMDHPPRFVRDVDTWMDLLRVNSEGGKLYTAEQVFYGEADEFVEVCKVDRNWRVGDAKKKKESTESWGREKVLGVREWK